MKSPYLRIIAIIISSVIWSCSADSDAYVKLVEKWQGRTIEYPSVMVDVATGDTIDISGADFTLITYIDSAGCTGYRMKLPRWTRFLDSLDSIAGDYEVMPIIAVNARMCGEYMYHPCDFSGSQNDYCKSPC